MRRLFTAKELGLTRSGLRAGERAGLWRRVEAGIYAEGPRDPTQLDRARAAVIKTGGVASESFAGWLLGLEGVRFSGPRIFVPPTAGANREGVRRRAVPSARVITVGGIACTDTLQTLVDLAATLDDAHWEQALECALRRGLVRLSDVTSASEGRQKGALRMRRVLALRPPGAPPTESLLETCMVQLLRTVPGLPPPQRQVRVMNAYDEEVARVDLAWPDLGLFLELDGQHHRGQPVYDSSRETAVVAATGWLCGRFTWLEVVETPVVTRRRVAALVQQARRLRPAAPPA